MIIFQKYICSYKVSRRDITWFMKNYNNEILWTLDEYIERMEELMQKRENDHDRTP